MAHSWCSMVLVMPCAKVGPLARFFASVCAAASTSPGSCSALKNPHCKPSSALMDRPEKSSSEARPWPISRGSKAHAPMSAPASPTRVNKKAVLARGVPSRMSAASAIMAPAPAQMPSIAAMMGCGHSRMALIRLPVMRVNSSISGIVICVNGPMISCTSPPEQKLPPAPVSTTTLTSLASSSARNRSRSSAYESKVSGFLRSGRFKVIVATPASKA